MDTSPNHTHVFLLQTVTTKLEAHNCTECLCVLERYSFPSPELRGTNLFQQETDPVHKKKPLFVTYRLQHSEILYFAYPSLLGSERRVSYGAVPLEQRGLRELLNSGSLAVPGLEPSTF